MVSEMTSPLVSVIIPCYNSAAHITAAIDSVLTQDYANIEVIVVDDGSTDNSIDILRQFGDKIIVLQQANQGPAAARNAGMRIASGQFIAFNDSDDLWLPGKLTAQITYLQQHPEIGLCYCGWAIWHGETSLEQISAQLADAGQTDAAEDAYYSGWLYLKLLKDSVIHTITAVMRREIIDTIGMFNTDYRIGEDHDFWLRISQRYQMAKLSQTYAVYRDNPHSTTKKVHAKNFSLLVLESAVARYGLTCPSGARESQAVVNNYLGGRHFTYGYNAMIQGHRDKALVSFKGCIRYRYRLGKAVLLSAICAVPLLYKLFLRKKIPASS
ncbi:Glycosyl transferase family 2 [Rheinheimera pacifica]|uniref:Glycosyl transferase family 2 n=2 Tax=Rheinheimera pacifica TaxID=173990 RepID=A0A1H6KAB4_9GAMM|nr:Glycosyl transferase family 2 [Rheinheimera pacifica]